MVEYNIQNPTIERAVQRESSSAERIRPDDTIKWVDDDGIFLPLPSKSMKGLEDDDNTAFGFSGIKWVLRR